ncbi:hypothetical protein [Vibrio splendidus]|uniref:hypothetical protein n=1 Tax=Vibrio splendidus TaxID=29497 RepID=UPI0015762999|nr:hypothetical protein [Vibrio splendidus]
MIDKKVNYFVRSLVVVLAAFIVWIIVYSLLKSTPSGVISAGVITLVILLVVIVLSETFDQFSVGKLFSLKREVEKKDGSIQKLSNENYDLRKELVNVVTSINQNQSSTNIIGVSSEDLAKAIGVVKATPDEITEKRTEENEDIPERIKPVRKRIDGQKLEELAFAKFLESKSLTSFDLIQEAKLVSQFSGIDAISSAHPIYDGYINTGESEIFIEVKPARATMILMRERIYVMLNKIYLYNKIKNANAHLNLLIVDVEGDDDDKGRIQRNSERLKEFFEPAILRGLLRVIPIKLSDEEKEQVYKQV